MPLEPGARLGPYEVVELLGAGGMGEVYKARDPRLAREVAIKVLAPSLAQDRDALARFEREAKTASALNHPHIVHIYEIGEAPAPSGPAHYIAMELVEGETLRARLKAGDRWMSLIEPLAQVADALAKAHKAGIVHRDLKPENVMLTPDGYPKVVDFGLAKLTEPSDPAAKATTPTEGLDGRTRSGMIVGTPSYMSPEQVQGKPLDPRSDIFSFGCILYEAASGRRPFGGDSTVATLHSIVYDEPPPLESLNADAPPELRRIVNTCLAKDPARRFQSIKDVGSGLRALTRAEATPRPDSVPTTAFTTEAAVGVARARRWLAWGAAVAVLGIAVMAGLRLRTAKEPIATRAPDRAIQVEKLTSRGDVGNLAISPDGRYVAYSSQEAGRHVIWLRDIGEKTEERLVDGIEAHWLGIRFSKTGKALYYSFHLLGGENSGLYKVPIIGGEPRLIDARNDGRGLSPDERHLAFTSARGGKAVLWIADLEDGREKEVGEVEWESYYWSPDGTQLIFSRKTNGRPSLFVVKADGTAERKIIDLPEGPAGVWWRPDSARLVYSLKRNDKELLLFELDLATGVTRPIGDKRWHQIDELYWLPDPAGFVVHDWDKEGAGAIWLVSRPDGKAERIPADSRGYDGLSMTADGTRLATIQSARRSDILVASSPETGSFKKIASGTEVTHSLSWTPDGKIVYSSNEGGSYHLYVCDADGANRRQLTFDRSSNEIEPAASPNGRYIVFVSDRSGEKGLYRINRDGTGIKSLTRPTVEHEDREPQLTPDSQWVIYRHLDDGPTLWKVPIDGGTPALISGARPAPPSGPREYAYGASASPDGRSFAFFYFTSDLAYDNWSPIDIVVSASDGHILRRLPYFPKGGLVKDGLRVQWGPNKALYYQSMEGFNLWRRPEAGGSPVQVTQFDEGLQDFDWSLDGKYLACSRESSLRDVVLITNFH